MQQGKSERKTEGKKREMERKRGCNRHNSKTGTQHKHEYTLFSVYPTIHFHFHFLDANTPNTWSRSIPEYAATSALVYFFALCSPFNTPTTSLPMKFTKTRSIVVSLPPAGGVEAIKSGEPKYGNGVCSVSSPTPGHDLKIAK